jgi:hypothetical protein
MPGVLRCENVWNEIFPGQGLLIDVNVKTLGSIAIFGHKRRTSATNIIATFSTMANLRYSAQTYLLSWAIASNIHWKPVYRTYEILWKHSTTQPRFFPIYVSQSPHFKGLLHGSPITRPFVKPTGFEDLPMEQAPTRLLAWHLSCYPLPHPAIVGIQMHLKMW